MLLKAVFFDIDGTLVPYDTRSMSQADIIAVEALRDRGVLIFIATGRHIEDINNIPFAVHGAVCNNGALTYIAKQDCAFVSEAYKFTLVDRHPIPQEQAVKIAQIVEEKQIPTVATLLSGAIISRYTQATRSFMNKVNMPVFKVEHIVKAVKNESVYSFCPFVTPEEESQIFKSCLYGLDTPRWCSEFCDINVHGLDKVIGVKKLADMFMLNSTEIMAFGDGNNDINMLKYAEVGVAMGNASDDVKAVADLVTDSVNNCGVSQLLSSMFA